MDLSILEKTKNTITIELGIPEPSTKTFEIGEESIESPRWPDAELTYDDDLHAILPLFNLPILLPPSGTLPELQVIDSEMSADDRLISVKNLGARKELERELPPSKHLELIQLEHAEDFRSFKTGSIIVSPYAISGQRLKKMTFQLVFPLDNIKGASQDNDIIPVYINGYMASKWAKVQEAKLAKTSLELPTGQWYTFPVNEVGIHRINVASFGSSVPESDPASWQVYAPYYEGRSLPYELSNTSPTPENLKQISMSGVGIDDGSFTGGDEILFFAQALNGDFKGDNFTHLYGKQRYYWLCVPDDQSLQGNQVIQKSSSTETPTQTVTNYEKRYYHEEDLHNQLHSGESWVGEKFTGKADNLTLRFTDDHIDRDAGVNLNGLMIWDYGIYGSGFTINFELNDWPIGTNKTISSLYRTIAFSGTGNGAMLQEGSNGIKLIYSNASATPIIYLDSLRLTYKRYLAPSADYLFGTVDLPGAVNKLEFADLNTDFRFWDITDPTVVKEWRLVNDHFTIAETGKREVIGFMKDQLIDVNLSEAANMGTPELRREGIEADYIIITPQIFMDEALRIKELRETLISPEHRLRVKIALLDDIYREFSAGTLDPAAIKHFLHYAYFSWNQAQAPPKYVLLLGDSDFDYRNITGLSKMVIPTYQKDGASDVLSYSTDDRYTYIASGTTDSKPDIAIGRLPAQTPDELNRMIDKIIAYETSPEPGLWRNTITLVADDPLRPSTGIETEHIVDTENLSRILPKSIYVDKIYLTEYPEEKDPNSPYIKKPKARDDLIKKLYNGTLMVNYLGHGSPNVWAQENVFTSADLGQVKTGMKLPFWIAGTCDWAKYDDIGASCVPEELMLMENNGAVGILSTTRKTYANLNEILLSDFFDLLFPDPEGSRSITVGAAVMMAKNAGVGIKPNNEKYILLSDPALRLASPARKGEIQSINPSSFKAMGKINYSGMTDTSLSPGAQAVVTVYDTPTPVTRPIIVPNSSYTRYISYVLSGKRIFRGLISIDDKFFSGNFMLPKDIKYSGEGGVLSVQYWDDTGIDGTMYIDTLKFLGTDSTSLDEKGPEILFLSENAVLLNGDHFSANEALEVELNDPQGINLTGVAGHGVTLAIDEDWDNGIDVTELFEYDLDHSDIGRLSAYLSEIPPGDHLISIKAWDSQNNPSEASVRLSFFGANDFRIFDLFNFPNPMVDHTEVTFMLSHSADLNFTVYSLAGRKLFTEDLGYQFQGYNTFPWNGRDQYGSRLANGVYIIVLEARNSGFEKPAQILQKIVIAR
ncbi:MAG: type IX secretion system sortase PorU [Candidatus Marinimicrobia bacterium]|nr:type IX secretion system sortase PorU [Candidatus Neomarinimicrobiota bacterium]